MSINRRKIALVISAMVYFFPLQLLIVHIKKNQQLLFFWLLLFLTIFRQIGNKYGVPLLLLEPEYLGKLSFWSYFIVGFALGGFVMAFNIASYIMNGFRFPFLATLAKPFFKYCINNAAIPLAFIISYLYCTYSFLSKYEDYSKSEIYLLLSGFLLGYILFIAFSLLYFMSTNKDLEKLFGKELTKVLSSDTDGEEPAQLLLSKKGTAWTDGNQNNKTWRVDTYIGGRFQLKRTRPFDHYDFKMLSKVFRQNHVNASFFEITVIASIILLGLFREKEIFTIPAGATLLLLITMVLMASSALRSWLRGWTWIVIFAVLFGINYWSKYDSFYFENRAYGLDYSTSTSYSSASLIRDESLIKADLEQEKKRLNNWAKKFKNKPKAVFLATSGGGSRAMLWSFLSLQHLDSLSNGALYEHCILSTGSSGGMIGAAYYRELAYRDVLANQQQRFQKKYAKKMAMDLLNPLFFSMAVNDMLIKTQGFEYDGVWYWKDRAYAFERRLNEISEGVLDKPLGDYSEPVKKAIIPGMVFSPSVVNDGRRMLISSQNMSFLHRNNTDKENLEYLELLKNHNPLNTRFLSVLRMNASFPYIMPTISLPTKPSLEVFDSGLRDNFGIKTTLQYIFQLKDWLEKNTSGIIILQIRDDIKKVEIDTNRTKRSLAAELLSPFGSLYGNLFQVQDYHNDELLSYVDQWYKGSIEVLNYQLNKSKRQPISLSWHLTNRDKESIYSSLKLENNIEIEQRLKQIFDEE